MKILISSDSPAGPHFVRMGWARVLQALGHDVVLWDPSQKPAFDLFAENQDIRIFLGQTYNLDRPLLKCLSTRPEIKVALFASSWGPLVEGVDLQKYPIVRVTEAEKRAVEFLKKSTGQPEFVFLHAGPRFLEGVLGGWRQIGVRPVSVLNAADLYSYLGGRPRQEFLCDVAFIGGRWPFKARNLDRFLLPLCDPNRGLNVKIWGNTPWPVANHLGLLEEEDARDVFVSARVCPNVSEPHSTDLGLGDVVERVFKVPAAGGCLISDKVEGVDDIFGRGTVPQADNPKDFEELVRFFITAPLSREASIARTREVVLANHCYHHRVSTLLGELGFAGEAQRCIRLLNEVLKHDRATAVACEMVHTSGHAASDAN